MANVKISALPAATTVASADVLPIVQSAITKKATFQVLSDALGVTSTVANTSPGLVYIKSQTIGSSVSSVTVSDAFSSLYDNYQILVSGGTASTSSGYLSLQLGSATTNYRYDYISANLASGTPTSAGSVGAANFPYIGFKGGNCVSAVIEVNSPFLAMQTMVSAPAGQVGNNMGTFVGVQLDTTSFTSFVIGASTGTITGGTITVYGYRKA